MSFFSIIVPVYNMAGKMGECFRSLTLQTFGDFEAVIVDDGSSDSGAREIDELCAADARFRCVRHEKNSSILVSRYTGLQNSNGNYVLFVDADDSLEINALELIYNSLQSDPVDILRFGHMEIYGSTREKTLCEKSRVIMPQPYADPLRAMLEDRTSPNVFKNCYSRAVAEKALDRAERFYCNMGEDVYWSTLLFSCAESFGILEQCLYRYNIGGGISTLSGTPAQLAEYAGHIRECMERVNKYLETDAPGLLELAARKYIRMNCFLMLVFVIDERERDKEEEYLKFFDTPDLRPVYRHGRDRVIPFKREIQTGGKGVSLNGRKIHYLEDLMPDETEV